MRIKKCLTILLTLVMVMSLLPQAAFAANNTATTMRLAKTQGKVAVTNVTNKKIRQTKNMKLYNGYKIKTGAKSYAWISLDNTKVAKLDANSVVKVQKNGQKLTLYLSSGNLFFNVKDPLKKGESFQIKTSTMTTGIRGTSGCVRVINPRLSEIHLLTGRVEVYAENPALGLVKTETLEAGYMATSAIDQESMQLTGEQVDIIIEELRTHTVCGNCSVEIAADPELQERIEAETDLNVEEIVETAEETLEEDEQAAEEEQSAIEEAEAAQELPEAVDPYFQEEESSGGDSSSAAVPTNVITVTNWQQFVAAVDTFHQGSENTEIKLAADITPDDGQMTPEIYHDSAALTINLDEYGLYLPSTMINRSDLTITNEDGFMTAYDMDTFDGIGAIIYNQAAGTINHIAGKVNSNSFIGIYNEGTYTLDGGTLTGGIGLENYGTAAISDGTVESSITNEGELTIGGGTITAADEAIVNNGGTIEMTGGTITSGYHGIAMNGGAAEVTGGTIDVDSDRDQAAAIYVPSSSEVTVGGTAVLDIMGTGYTAAPYGAAGIWTLNDPGDVVFQGNAEIHVNGFKSAGIILQDKGALDISGGTIVLEEHTSTYWMSGVHINGEMTMSGGTITTGDNDEDMGIESYGDVTMTGGTIKVNSGIGIVNRAAGTLRYEANAAINANGAEAKGILNGGTAELTGGTIAVRETATDAIAVSTSGELKTDGDVSITVSGDNTGIYASDGTLELADGEIEAYGEAIAVVLRESGTTVVPNVIRPIKATIKWTGQGSNTTVYENGAVVESYETINFSGNSADHLMQPLIDKGDTQDPGPVTEETKGLDPETGREIVVKDYYRQAYFTDMYGVGGGFDIAVSDASGFLDAIKRFNTGLDDSKMTLTSNITITEADITAYGDASIENTASTLTIDLAEYTLTLEKQLHVAERASLKIVDGGTATTTTGTINGTADPLINNEGTFELAGGTMISPGINAVENTGTVKMTGGVIYVNTMTDVAHCKGISSAENSVVEMTGGTIRCQAEDTIGISATNAAVTVAGGSLVAVGENSVGIQASGGTLTYGAGSFIETQTSTATGIHMADNCAGTLSGGEINVYRGTGVQVDSNSTATVAGVTIYGMNTDTDHGIATDTNGTVIMNSGTITVDAGAGIYTDGGVVKLNGGTINVTGAEVGNTDATYAQGVSGRGADTITLNGTTINTATDDCTGIYTSNGSAVTVSDGTVNVSGGYGIRLNSTGCRMTMTDGTIHVKDGGNIGIAMAGNVGLNGGTITVDAGTGINVVENTLTMTGGTITAADGAVGINNNSTANLNGGTITATGDTAVAVNNGGKLPAKITTVIQATADNGLPKVDEFGQPFDIALGEDGYYVLTDPREKIVVEEPDDPAA